MINNIKNDCLSSDVMCNKKDYLTNFNLRILWNCLMMVVHLKIKLNVIKN